MEQLEALKRQIESARELQSLVRVMETLAAARVREYGRAVESLVEYSRTVEMGLQVVMRNRPREMTVKAPVHKRVGAVIFGSEQGLCGAFNEQIAAYAVNTMDKLGIKAEDRAVVVVGERLESHLQAAGQAIEQRYTFFGDHLGMTQVILMVLTKIEEWDLRRGLDAIVLFHNTPESKATFRPQMQYLLPVDVEWLLGLAKREWEGRSIPTFTMDWDRLFAALIRQHMFFLIYRAFVESLASENTSRLIAMQAATRNIEERLGELSVKYHNTRQSSITSELLDIINGYEAMSGREETKSNEGAGG